jgi:hypothetical protein
MKNSIIALLVFLLLGFGYYYVKDKLFLSAAQTVNTPSEKFIQLKGGKFYLNKEPFFPIALNFVVSLRANDTAMWPAVYISYLPEELWSSNKDSCQKQLKNTLQLIKDMGFNTVRLTHIGEPEISDFKGGRIGFTALEGLNGHKKIYLESDEQYSKYLNAINDLLAAVDAAGLKAIFTVRMFHEAPRTEEYLKRISVRFKENTTLLAYDFFNEPLYFDSIKHTKEEVYKYTKIWTDIVKYNAPNHLTTVGLACQRELFVWDPNLVNVDFLSMHPYEYEPDQVRNELYWYHKYIKKPWIIGETGVPSNNDSIPYENQVLFARKILKQLVNCNGQGFSWWQYKDLDWGYYHQNYLGVVNRKGETRTSTGQMVHGTPKPITTEIKSFDSKMKKEPCFCPENYYNFSSNNKFLIKGKIVDAEGKGIDGGGVLAWDQWWINHYFSTSKSDGSFELYSSYPFYHWMVSSTLHEMIRKDINPDTAKTINGIPTINLGTIVLEKVDID